MDSKYNPKSVDDKVENEINHFLKDQPYLKEDVKYAYKIAIPDRPKAYLMFEFAKVLGVDKKKIMPFAIVADLMMAAAMNDDEIIDNSDERCGEKVLWKIKGINSTIMVTGYMYALIFSILKRYRPQITSQDFLAYQKSENLLLDYFREMHIAQYNTTISSKLLADYNLRDLEKLAIQKASLLFQFCCAVPAYFANNFIEELENFGFQLGIARQYISDVQDFLMVPGDSYKQEIRMEDYFTHQPNLVLVLTGASKKLTEEERKWFYHNWMTQVLEKDKEVITKRVLDLINKTESIEESKKELRKIREKLQSSLSNLPNEEFKKSMSKWAFRSFSMD